MGKKLVLLYHRINNTKNDYNRITVEEEYFRAHMSFLKENYKVITFEEMLSYEGEDDAVTITFDDGFSDFYEKALPVLMEYEIPATVFITTGKLDTTTELWTTDILRMLFEDEVKIEELKIELFRQRVILPIFTIEQRAEAYRILRHILMQLGENARESVLDSIREQLEIDPRGRNEYLFMSKKEVREIGNNPLITIGAHTVNHISMSRVDDMELLREVQDSIRDLESILERKIKYFAYPFGGKNEYSDKAVDILRHCGIEAACAVVGEILDSIQDDIYRISRLNIGNWPLELFRDKLEQYISNKEPCENIQSEQQLSFIGKLESDTRLWKSDRKIVIWGTGIKGQNLYEKLSRNGQAERILAFGDNNEAMWGHKIDNTPIWNVEQVKKMKDVEVVFSNVHDMQLFQQFIGENLQNLHWII